MRIAYLSTMRGYYGGEVCLHSLATGMRDRGHEVACIAKPESGLAAALAGSGLSVCRLPLVDWFEPFTIARLTRWLRSNEVAILHTHVPRDYYIAGAATLGTAVRNVGTRHHLARISKALLKRPFLSRFDRMIAVSEAVHARLQASGVIKPSRLVTIHNGVDPEPDGPGRERSAADLRRAVGLRPTDLVVGFIGRLRPEKGLETLLEAGYRLRPRHPDLRLVLVGDEGGDGSYTCRLRKLAAHLGLEHSVRFCGYRSDAASLAGALDVLVVCSRAEPFGLVTLEAMARSRPVVATDSGGSPEIVRDGVEGFLVAPGDAAALARRLDLLLDSSGLRREMGRRGWLRVEQAFSRRRMLDRTENLYRAVLESAAASCPTGRQAVG